MKINEIISIGGNSFERLKNRYIYDEVDQIYSRMKAISDLHPGKLAVDVLGDEYNEYKEIVKYIHERAATVYPPTDSTFLRIAEIYKYINQ